MQISSRNSVIVDKHKPMPKSSALQMITSSSKSGHESNVTLGEISAAPVLMHQSRQMYRRFTNE